MSASPLIKVAVAILLMVGLFGCSPKGQRSAVPAGVAEETLVQANSEGFEYIREMDAAKGGNEDAIRELFRFSTRVDAAGAIGHGVALVGLFDIIGEQKPAQVAMSLRSEE